ncbi:hypothetical protein FZEAL_7380 [Fusarium zealandicum]|uniref:Pt repeat family protein n=1 Tax=Fusarium zealandicum TaxID=1053134 RepID=A0A8H4UFY0_9HYPO|nr:hypothetical protein FZEAL_7380 [Fusarium zealandicum]
MPLRRPKTSGDGPSGSSSPSFSLGTKRRFPLLGRRKTRDSELPRPSSVVLPSTSPSQKITKPGLRVHVQVKFESPIGSEHVRDYEASPQLKASDRLCQALLSRLQHCSTELITRHDSTAVDPLRKPHRDVKPLRYRITYRVERDGLVLVEKSLRSFQEYELTHDDAREVIAATDRIVGLFLVRHDPGFQWSESAESESANPESETIRPCTGRPQSTACIPRFRFIHETQSFELAAGYSIELFLRSRCNTRYPENRNASIKIDSRQPSPLTLLLGEELTTRVSNLVIDPVDAWKRKFDKRHKNCVGFEGSGGCSHTEDGALDIMVKVRNHLGPDYTYFSHRIQTSKVLFNDPQGRDFDEFANQVKVKLEKARDMTDKSMRSLDDLTLHVRELRGSNWSVHEPLLVRLDPTITYCRQTIEAVMERLQTGISHVLEHHEDALATITVHKRGHLIFDGFLDGAGGDDNMPLEKFATSDLERKALEASLKERIRADITTLCRDTCALDCPDTLPNLRLKARGTAVSTGAASALASPSSKGASTPIAPTHSLAASASFTGRSSDISIPGSLASSRSDHGLSKKVGQQNLKDTSQPPSSPAIPSLDLRRVPSGVEMAKKHGYMADFMADDENQSEPPSTPSLVDTDSISPRDSILATPQSLRTMPRDQSNEGLRIVDDGRRIIYQEQSDMDAIASGVVQFHRPINDDDEPIQLTKERPEEPLEKRAARRSLDTRMPDLSSNTESVLTKSEKNDHPVAPRKEQEQEPENPSAENAEAKASTKELLSEAALENLSKPAPLVVEESKQEKQAHKQADVPIETPRTPEPEAKVEAVHGEHNNYTVAPQVTKPTEALVSSTEEKTETPQTSQDEQWEMVEANNPPRDLPSEIEPNTKSETSFETKPAASVRGDGEGAEISTSSAASALNTSSEIGLQIPKVIPVVLEQPEIAQVDSMKNNQENSILDDFPKPPPSVGSHTDDVFPHDEKLHEEELQAKELSEPTEVVEAPQREVVQAPPQPEPVRESSDSGISMEEQTKVQETQAPVIAERAEVEPVSATHEASAVPIPIAEVVERAPEPGTFKVDVSEPIEHAHELNTADKQPEPVAQDELPTEQEPDAPVMGVFAHFLETVPEDTLLEPATPVAEDAHIISTEPTKPEQPETPPNERVFLPTISSAPLEAFPPRDDFFSLPSVPEKDQGSAPTKFKASDLPAVLPRTRPRTNTLPQRRYSSALTLDLDIDPFDREDDGSPTGDSPKSAIGAWGRDSLHRRQASAGFVGLREQRLHSIGLRSALVPYRWQALRRDQAAWEGRPGTSHSEQ